MSKTSKEIIKEIDEAIADFRGARAKVNEALTHARTALNKGDDTEAYNKGLEAAWKLAKVIGDYTWQKNDEIFGCTNPWMVLRDYTPQEALEKIEAYEKEQAEVKVGDVVKVEAERCPFVVIAIYGNDVWCYRMAVGLRPLQNLTMDMIKKTGKHIDIQSVLEQIGGGE